MWELDKKNPNVLTGNPSGQTTIERELERTNASLIGIFYRENSIFGQVIKIFSREEDNFAEMISVLETTRQQFNKLDIPAANDDKFEQAA